MFNCKLYYQLTDFWAPLYTRTDCFGEGVAFLFLLSLSYSFQKVSKYIH
jgi:hypothetical protein